MTEIEFVIKFGEWCDEHPHEAIKAFCFCLFLAFVVCWIGATVWRKSPDDDEEENQDGQNNDVCDKDGE